MSFEFKDGGGNAREFNQQSRERFDHNIDRLMELLGRDDKKKGYEDALVNPDLHHMEQNVLTIKSEINRCIMQVMMFYEDFIEENNRRYEAYNRAAMVDAADQLNVLKNIAMSRMEKIRQLAMSLKEETEEPVVVSSYRIGFKNGIAHLLSGDMGNIKL